MRAISRSVASCDGLAHVAGRAQVVDLDRRAVGDPQRPEREQPVGAGDGCRDERHSGLQRDPRRAGPRPRLGAS